MAETSRSIIASWFTPSNSPRHLEGVNREGKGCIASNAQNMVGNSKDNQMNKRFENTELNIIPASFLHYMLIEGRRDTPPSCGDVYHPFGNRDGLLYSKLVWKGKYGKLDGVDSLSACLRV